MKKETKSKIMTNLRIIGLHYEKYRLMMIIVASIVAAIALFFTIYWEYDETTSTVVSDSTYLIAYLLFLGLSIAVIVFLILNKYKIIKTLPLAILVHVYSFLLIAWATFVGILDLSIGASPFIYVIILTALAGLFVVEPIIYSAEILISFCILMVLEVNNHYAYFNNEYLIENLTDVLLYIVVVVATTFRHFNITIREFKAQEKLTELTYYDELTGLLNERSYITATEEINNNIQNNKDTKFAVVLMDVNNLKATNDAYGHRYGCHLIVRCGHTLPEVFKSSKLFHIGGDEFIAIVLGEDFDNLEKLIEEFKKTFDYSLIEFDGHELIFSVAHGIGIYQEGDKFQDVLQRADQEMYMNKKALKEKYGMKSRQKNTK